ncbi:hypothetical protein BAOM_2808 [Peribacillus asahii]|uniref:Uncharacterized protein n=1 Tax=Peribacillus asahii TaxID=228899 RepID=A0A3T0KSP3_9BACI|nr:hypothetical protein BAOM_2808 [Peribacillus asahii]
MHHSIDTRKKKKTFFKEISFSSFPFSSFIALFVEEKSN